MIEMIYNIKLSTIACEEIVEALQDKINSWKLAGLPGEPFAFDVIKHIKEQQREQI